ncbi:hypothetical protein [Gilvimarinus xylanilyticus]|uniref:Lipoprotein n=1 Tax=Gilvimarinus xylanilyticus TaxID=2944139 RepID=A0A9X2KSR1_9GAMM|nr:hypothetical protein [Gilvimarinus xylanilyticus]MCP8899081.1 hypothetical protein [Gilvimarinus xylanilyticus]
MKIQMGLLFALALLGGCKEGEHHSPPPPPPQALIDYALIDSYGVDSDYDPGVPLVIDPYVEAGVFEVFWEVRYAEPYRFYLSMGETPYIDDSLRVYERRCGPGRACNLDGYALCQYRTDFTLACENGPWVDMLPIIYKVPQDVYLFAEICGPDGCHSRRLPVQMY